ncbi:MAG: CAAX prenyl protease-related protein [Janthinobacterium lividum]
MTPPPFLTYTESMTLKSLPAWVPYVLPFGLFLLLTMVESHLPLNIYPIFYAVKIVLVGGVIFRLRGAFPEARPGGSGWAAATALGTILFFVWIAVDRHTPHFAFLGTRTAYNPAREMSNSVEVFLFLVMRFIGLVVVVPIVEELFYRGFLLRFVTDLDDFQRVPTGTFSLVALLINVGVFALSHPEWLAAAIFALALCGLLRWTKNFFTCILAHGVTNLLLGVYILHTAQWQYW